MNDILDTVLSGMGVYTQKRNGIRTLYEKYRVKGIDDVDWVDLCEDACAAKEYKFGLFIMRELLRTNLYHGRYADDLYENLAFYNQIECDQNKYHKLLCGANIQNQIAFYTNYGAQNVHCFFIQTENKFIKNILTQYLFSDDVPYVLLEHTIFVFEKSFGKYRHRIGSINDFTAKTLFTQANYYKQHFKNDERKCHRALGLVVSFYRWLVKTYPECEFFANTFEITDTLLFNGKFTELLWRGFYFTQLNPANIPYDKERICFIVKGRENQSTEIIKNGYILVDFSKLQFPLYRNLVIEYVVTSLNISSISNAARIICAVLQALYDTKQTDGYPNKNLTYLTNQEAIFIRQYIAAQDISISTKNHYITFIRSFIAYCVSNKTIHTDDIFSDYLTAFGRLGNNAACAVPDDDLIAIHKALLERSVSDIFYKEMLVIFHLAIQTEFRINQICHLEIDCIKPTIKPNQFMIQSISKTSHGMVNSYVISNQTYHLLMDIIEETEKIRAECYVDSLKRYVFLYPHKNTRKTTVLFNDCLFSRTLQDVCCDIGIPPYTANNLRDTHMTKSFEHILRTGKSELEMSVLSKHKHIDTTKNHYIEMELEKMLESTYGVTIGTELIETDTKVVDDIPDHLTGEENDVEDGCGKCSAEACVMTNALPCMACKHFITTVKHEVFFKKAIENINRLIENTKNRHDKEDLVTIKELYVLYLKAIIKHKEAANEN